MTPDTTQRIRPAVIDAWITACETGSANAMRPLLAAQAVLISPLTSAFRFGGATQVETVFACAFDLVHSVQVHTVTSNDDGAWAIFLTGVVGGRRHREVAFEEVHLLRLDDDSLIAEVTLIGRPVPALLAIMATIGTRMAARGLMPAVAGVTSAGVRPVAAAFGLIERFVMLALRPRDPA